MFSLFNKDPAVKLQKDYNAILRDAMQAQRNGDIKLYSELSGKAEKILEQIDALN